MPMFVEGFAGLEAMLLRIDTTAKKRVSAKLFKKAKDIQRIAMMMAPRDKTNLENAIHVRPEGIGERLRDDLGRYRRVEFEVYVDMEMPIPDRPGKTVGDYAYEMHEHLEPAGPLNLGPESRMKQAETGVQVGGGYLTRAVAESIHGLTEELAADLMQSLEL